MKKLILAFLLAATTAFGDYIKTESVTELIDTKGVVVYRLEINRKIDIATGEVTIGMECKVDNTSSLTKDQKDALINKTVSVSRLVKES